MTSELKVAWADAKAARFACTRWHYSKTVPPGVANIVGVWEGGQFVGVVMFARGASPMLGAKFSLKQTECCELVRIALRAHKTPVTRVVKFALRLLQQRCPGVRLVVSFADANEGHHGGIYQGGNWIYAGLTPASNAYFDKTGRRFHQRQITASGFVREFGALKRCPKRADVRVVQMVGKHRYLMPLDASLRAALLPLAKPYPKRDTHARVESAASGTSANQAEGAGAEPSSTLQSSSGADVP